MGGKVISFDHVWVTQSTSYLAWKPGMVSGKRVPGGTYSSQCECCAHTVRHSMGMEGGQSSVNLHMLCKVKCVSAQVISYSYL